MGNAVCHTTVPLHYATMDIFVRSQRIQLWLVAEYHNLWSGGIFRFRLGRPGNYRSARTRHSCGFHRWILLGSSVTDPSRDDDRIRTTVNQVRSFVVGGNTYFSGKCRLILNKKFEWTRINNSGKMVNSVIYIYRSQQIGYILQF